MERQSHILLQRLLLHQFQGPTTPRDPSRGILTTDEVPVVAVIKVAYDRGGDEDITTINARIAYVRSRELEITFVTKTNDRFSSLSIRTKRLLHVGLKATFDESVAAMKVA